jgi:hypothetical protein
MTLRRFPYHCRKCGGLWRAASATAAARPRLCGPCQDDHDGSLLCEGETFSSPAEMIAAMESRAATVAILHNAIDGISLPRSPRAGRRV